jgi:transcriptional regulator with XRE-family HTH domain
MDSREFLKLVGGKIRAIRKARGISQEKLAELSGLHPTYISEIERGTVNASLYSFYLITTAFNIPFAELASIPSGRPDKKTESEIAALLSDIRSLDKKKQTLFFGAVKGLLSGLKNI